MKLIRRLFSGLHDSNPTTALERERLNRTMPGETGALTAHRLGFLLR